MTEQTEPLPADTPADQIDEQPEPPAMTAVALLAADGTYLGIGPVMAVAEVGADQVAIPVDCDLAPGRYRWDAGKNTFVPLGKASALDATPPPDALEAMAFGLLAQWKAGTTLHDKTLRWLDAWLTGIDKMKSIDGGGHLYASEPLVVEYAVARGLLKGRA
jgi:hypothetical protein